MGGEAHIFAPVTRMCKCEEAMMDMFSEAGTALRKLYLCLISMY